MQNQTVNNYINKIDASKGLDSLISSFPAFELNRNALEGTLESVVEEKLRLAVDSNKYGTLTGLNIGYDEFVHVQRMSNAKLNMNEKQQKMLAYMEDVLPKKMSKDPNMSMTELMRSTISLSISDRVNDSLMNLQFLNASNENSPHPVTIMEAKQQKEKLAGTLIMVKEMYPVVYSQVESSMQDMAFDNIFKDIQGLIKNPSKSMKEDIFNCNPNIAKKIYPLESEEFKTLPTNSSINIKNSM